MTALAVPEPPWIVRVWPSIPPIRPSNVVAVVLLALAGLGGGLYAATAAGSGHDTTYVVSGVVEPTGAGQRYTVTTTAGTVLAFRHPPELRTGDYFAVRTDPLGRILGTIRHGEYIPKEDQPSRLPFVAITTGGLVTSAAAGMVALQLLDARRWQRVGAPLVEIQRQQPVFAAPRVARGVLVATMIVAGFVGVASGVRLFVLGTFVEHDVVHVVASSLATRQGSANPDGVVFTDGTYRYFRSSTLEPGEIVVERVDGLGRLHSTTAHGVEYPSDPAPSPIPPVAFQHLVVGAGLFAGGLVVRRSFVSDC